MKHISYLLWLIAAVPLVAIIGFLTRPQQDQRTSSADTKNAVITTSSAPKPEGRDSTQFAADGSRIKQLSPAGVAAREQYLEAKKKADEAKVRSAESAKKVSALLAPENHSRIVDGIMKRRDHEYRKLFAPLNLTQSEADAILGLIRKREVSRLENLSNHLKDPSSVKSANDKVSSDQAEDSVSQELASLVLGESRAKELLNAIQQMERTKLANAALELNRKK